MSAVYARHLALLVSVSVYDMILDYPSNKYNSGDCS